MFDTNNPQGVQLAIAGEPTSGTSCVQTLTLGGTPTGGSFYLSYQGYPTAAIAWTDTDADLATNVKAALEALWPVGPNTITVAATTGSSGIGDYTITFGGALANLGEIPLIAVYANALAGTNPTVAVAMTIVGVTATLRGAYRGTRVCDYSTGKAWVNAGAPTAPTWVRSDHRVAEVPLTATDSKTGGAVASWTPAEGGPVAIVGAVVYTTTKSTGAATLDIGVAADATTSSNTMFTGLDVGTGVVCTDIPTSHGDYGQTCQVLAAGEYVTVTGSDDTTGLVGTLYIEYLEP